jgi:uncharacterized RDD family membrane protein YckC
MSEQELDSSFPLWRRRVLVELVDFIIVIVIASVLLLIIGEHALWYTRGGRLPKGVLTARYVAVDLSALLYYPLLTRNTNGQTIGKQLLKLRVIRIDGRHMSLSLATYREFGLKFVVPGLVGLLPLRLGIGEVAFLIDGLWPLWDRENRALHDMIAGTRVVRVSSAAMQEKPEMIANVG